MKIGFFGGSFDPVHSEHKKMALSAARELGLDRLFIVPASLPPHRLGESRADFDDRFDMLRIAFDGSLAEVSDVEGKRSGASYTYLTAEYFKREFSSAEIFFLVGTDMLLDFPSWKNPDKILDCVTIAVTPRDGENLSYALDRYNSRFNKPPIILPYLGKDISSTKIKAYLRLGVPTGDMLDENVKKYIAEHGLYAGDRYYEYVKNRLPEKRRRHTANVIVKALEYAKRLGEDKAKAELAALLHDAAKYSCGADFPDFECPTGVPPQIIHQFLGRFVAERVLGVRDEDVLNAVNFHTTGRIGMSRLEKIVFLADLLEEDRSFDGVEEIRREVDADFDRGFAFALKELVGFLKKDGESIYPLTEKAADYYGKILKGE